MLNSINHSVLCANLVPFMAAPMDRPEPSQLRPTRDLAVGEDQAGDAELERLSGIPRVVGLLEQFEDTGDR